MDRCNNIEIDRPWLGFYGENLPGKLSYPTKAMPQLLDDVVAAKPDRAALIFLGRKTKYRAFAEATKRFACLLARLGVKAGDRVCLFLPNTPHMVIAYYGCLRLGAVVVPTNPLYTVRELRHQVADSQSRILVTLDLKLTLDKIQPLVEEGLLDRVIVGSVGDYLPPPTKLIYSLLKRKDLSPIPTHGAYLRYGTALAKVKPDEVSFADPQLDDLAVLMYTGGTTGVSKGAMLTHRNIMANAVQGSFWSMLSTQLDFTKHDTTLVILPLFHSYSMTVCMNRNIFKGGTLLLFPQRPRKDLLDMLKVIKQHQPTEIVGVPTLFNAMVNQPRCTEFGVDAIRICNSGAAPLPVDVIRRFEEMTGSVILEGYGLSEASPCTHCNPVEGVRKPGSVGIPFPDTDAIIWDEKGGKPAQVGQEGELLVRGPQVMKGYWNRPEETAQALKNGWLHTGDIAKMDKDGYFQIVDRKKDLIITSGYNIYPREIEEVLHEHPAVLEAAAIGVPDEARGERVKAVVALKDGMHATPEEIVAFCKERLAIYKVPKYVEIKAELPKTSVGKVLRRVLREAPDQPQEEVTLS